MAEIRTIGDALSMIARMPEKERNNALTVIHALAEGCSVGRIGGYIILTPPPPSKEE